MQWHRLGRGPLDIFLDRSVSSVEGVGFRRHREINDSLRQSQNAPPAAGRRDRWGTFGRKLILRREPLLVVPDDFRFLGVHVLFLQHAG